jgi:hypothetical protein
MDRSWLTAQQGLGPRLAAFIGNLRALLVI